MHESNTQTNNPPEISADSDDVPLSVEIAIQREVSVNVDQLETIVRRIVSDHGFKRCEISIAVVDDVTIHDLNRRYLNHDYATDVLSFPSSGIDDRHFLQGEVVVSADTAEHNAGKLSVSPESELLLYIIHGMLHLVGLDDRNAIDRKQMRESECRYASLFGFDYVNPDESVLGEGSD